MTKIFISYRRKDNPFAARSVYEALCVEFGKDNVFYDVERMRAGRDFREQIDKMLSWCDVMLVVIGDQWLQTDESGKSRLENPEDSLRIEVSTALSRGIKVIPVLIGDAQSLTEIEPSLPEDIKPLVYRHYIVVEPGEDFKAHIDKLIKQIATETREEKPVKTQPWKWLAVPILVIAIVLVIWRSYDPAPESVNVPDAVKKVIEQLKEYDSFSSNIATTEGAKEILDSLGLQDISWKEGEYATAPINNRFAVTIWAQSHNKPNVFGVRYGTSDPSWDWEATYFEIVIPHDFVVTNCQPNLTLNQPEISEMTVTINGVVLPSEGCPEIVRMGWRWGDTALRVDSWFPASHKYSEPGDYDINVIAYDAEQNSVTESVRITIVEPEQVDTEGESSTTQSPKPVSILDIEPRSDAARAYVAQGVGYYSGMSGYIDNEKARSLFEQAVRLGDPVARMWLARGYHKARFGLEENIEIANLEAAEVIGEIQILAQTGDVQAMFLLGSALSEGLAVTPNPSESVRFYKNACDLGELLSCTNLGLAHERGEGVGKDAWVAAELYKQACDGGEMNGCLRLAVAYSGGNGVPKNPALSTDYYRKACDRNSTIGCSNLGFAYAKGIGVEKNPKRAAELFKKVCDDGHARGCHSLGYAYRTGEGVEKDDARAVELYRKACDGGDSSGCHNLGWHFAEGLGVTKDAMRAAQLYTMACDDGLANSCHALGYAYGHGEGVEKDIVRAAELYRKACDGGLAKGCNNLGNAYSNGEGVPKDSIRAAELYKMACDGGFKPACD